MHVGMYVLYSTYIPTFPSIAWAPPSVGWTAAEEQSSTLIRGAFLERSALAD